jgi:hypothetical protein
MLDVFLLDVFRRFVLGMLFLLAGLSVCHGSTPRRVLLRATRTTHLPVRRSCVNLRADGTGSSPRKGRQNLEASLMAKGQRLRR